MIGRLFAFFLGFLLTAGEMSLCSEAQTLLPAETVLREYEALIDKVNLWQGRVHLRGQRMLLGEMSLDMKKEFDQLYNFSPLNPIYRENQAIFFKSHAAMDWDVKIQPGVMSGEIVIQNSVAELTASMPIVDLPDPSILHRLTLSAPIKHPFALIVDPTQVETNVSQFVLPQLIVDWHYLPRLWYPPLDKIGFPSDPQSVRVRMQDEHMMAFLFTPTHMDNHLLSYLRVLSGIPDLGFSDLTNILLLDSLSFTCRSFSITIQSEGKQRPIFSITHSDPDSAPHPFPIPSISTIMTSWRERKDDQSVWVANYFCQFSITNIFNR